MEKTAFEGGATRSTMRERFDLIPQEAACALARRLALGAEKHGENNWRKGGPEFRRATLNHIMKHLLDYMENGNENDANTDAIICNAAFLCFFEERAPFLPQLLRGTEQIGEFHIQTPRQIMEGAQF